jgi:hypothetical protein
MLRIVLRANVAVLLVGWSVAAGLGGCKEGHSHAKPGSTNAEPQEPSAEAPVPLPALMTAGDGGAVTLGTTLPADFPSDVPIYEGARILFAGRSTSAEGRTGWTATLETGDTKDHVVEFYKSHLTTFKLATRMDMGETTMAVWQAPKYDVTLMATVVEDQKTTVTLTVGTK